MNHKDSPFIFRNWILRPLRVIQAITADYERHSTMILRLKSRIANLELDAGRARYHEEECRRLRYLCCKMRETFRGIKGREDRSYDGFPYGAAEKIRIPGYDAIPEPRNPGDRGSMERVLNQMLFDQQKHIRDLELVLDGKPGKVKTWALGLGHAVGSWLSGVLLWPLLNGWVGGVWVFTLLALSATASVWCGVKALERRRTP